MNFQSFFKYFSALATSSVVAIGQAQQDIAKGDHTAAVVDVLNTAAGATAVIAPQYAGVASGAAALASVIVEGLVEVFHAAKTATPAAALAAPAVVTPAPAATATAETSAAPAAAPAPVVGVTAEAVAAARAAQ